MNFRSGDPSSRIELVAQSRPGHPGVFALGVIAPEVSDKAGISVRPHRKRYSPSVPVDDGAGDGGIVGDDLRIFGGERPQVTLGWRYLNGVPVDQFQARSRGDRIAAVRLPWVMTIRSLCCSTAAASSS